jgi:hypothetical protein
MRDVRRDDWKLNIFGARRGVGPLRPPSTMLGSASGLSKMPNGRRFGLEPEVIRGMSVNNPSPHWCKRPNMSGRLRGRRTHRAKISMYPVRTDGVRSRLPRVSKCSAALAGAARSLVGQPRRSRRHKLKRRTPRKSPRSRGSRRKPCALVQLDRIHHTRSFSAFQPAPSNGETIRAKMFSNLLRYIWIRPSSDLGRGS